MRVATTAKAICSESARKQRVIDVLLFYNGYDDEDTDDTHQPSVFSRSGAASASGRSPAAGLRGKGRRAAINQATSKLLML
ncbi:MAG: hypothetical protein Q9180_002613 [Flavoplaca navasiana]